MYAVHFEIPDIDDSGILTEIYPTPGKAHAALMGYLFDREQAETTDTVESVRGPEDTRVAREVTVRREGFGLVALVTIYEVVLA